MIQLPDRAKFYVFPRKDFTPGIAFDKFENFVKIRTKHLSEDKEDASVDYYIDVPYSINLKDIVVSRGNITINEVYGDAFLDLSEGDIVVENFSGALTASVIHGSVNVSLFDLRDEDEIFLNSGDGDITLSLQENANAHLVVSFPEGEISSEFEFELPLDQKEMDIQLGENGPHISITASRGDVRIKKDGTLF
jgi:Ca2+-binding RTX toxin-like protein